jgi:hypothetical protein
MRIDMNFWLFVFIDKAVKCCVCDVTDAEQGNGYDSKKTMRDFGEIL